MIGSETVNVNMERQNGTEYIQRSPDARFALATSLLCFNEDNLKWGLRNIKKEDIINFQFRFSFYLT
jgi:hypothetical protein